MYSRQLWDLGETPNQKMKSLLFDCLNESGRRDSTDPIQRETPREVHSRSVNPAVRIN